MSNLSQSFSVLLSIAFLLTSLAMWQCTDKSLEGTPPTSVESEVKASLSRSGSEAQALAEAGYPDLTVDATRLAQSLQIQRRNFKSTDCAVVETCALPGKRKLLRFDVAVINFGTADLIVGNPLDHPELFEYSPCHGHYHYKNFSEYRLKNTSGFLLRSRKQAFCLIDNVNYWQGYPSNGYTCTNQGLSVGWADVYNRYVDCQWIDITDVPRGNYTLEVEVNLSGAFYEGTNTYSNIVSAPVTIH